MDARQLIESLATEAKQIRQGDIEAGAMFIGKAKMITKRIFGPNSEYAQEMSRKIFPSPDVYSRMENGERQYKETWQFALRELLTTFHTMSEDIRIFGPPGTRDEAPEMDMPLSNRVFIVHGHDEEMLQSVARVIGKLELEPIVLKEQPDEGHTIIEKFGHYADVSFAIVLLSPDDKCYTDRDAAQKVKVRPRQNVIFELGFFVGKLGRKNVRAIYRKDPNFEMLSDYAGVLYIPYDEAWKFSLVKELKARGYTVSADRVL